MLRTLKIFSLILLVSGLSMACSKSESEKTQETVDNLNKNEIPRANAIAVELSQLGYELDPWGVPKTPAHPSYENMDKATSLLNEYIEVGNRILKGAANPDVIFTEAYKVEKNIEQAESMLKAISSYRASKVELDKADDLVKKYRETDAQVKADLQKINDQLVTIFREDKIKVLTEEKSMADSQIESARAISNMKSIESVKAAQARFSDLRNSIENFLESAESKRKITGNPSLRVQNNLARTLRTTKELQNSLDERANTLNATDESAIIEGLEYQNPFEAQAI